MPANPGNDKHRTIFTSKFGDQFRCIPDGRLQESRISVHWCPARSCALDWEQTSEKCDPVGPTSVESRRAKYSSKFLVQNDMMGFLYVLIGSIESP